MPPEERDPLEDLLDAAGRAVQPGHPGWQSLNDRLAARPQQRRRSRRWRVAAATGLAAAGILLAVGLLLFLPGPTPTPAREIEVRRLDVDLTVLSGAETHGETLYMPLQKQLSAEAGGRRHTTGQALVKDHRLVLNLRRGDNVVRFTDVAASIDPTSVRFVSTTDPDGTRVVEQNFEFDLATADSLLQRCLEHEVACIGKDGREVSGTLVAFDGGNLVVASGAVGKSRTTQSLPRATLQAVRLNEVPADLLVKPTLVWKLRTEQSGRHDTLLTYLCGLMQWHADYVAVVTPGDGRGPDRLDLTGWVTLENRSGATYEKAGLKLIAGDVHRQHDPWAALEDIRDKNLLRIFNRGGHPPEGRKELVENAFFDYHLYTLTAPSTVRDRETKQLALLHRTAVKADRRYVFDPALRDRHLAVELVAKNDKDNQLGLPLPKGSVTVEQRDRDGDSEVLGRVPIDHTAVNEELTLRYGSAFDVTGTYRQTDRDRGEIRVRNHQEHAIRVRAVAHLPRGRQLQQASLPAMPHDATTVFFDFDLPPNAEQVITYTPSVLPEIFAAP
jgi:hypothetical protein